MKNARRIPQGNPVIERIEELLTTQKKTKKELLRYLGLGESAFTRWKYDNGKSYVKYIKKIAEFLCTTSDYLLNGDTNNTETSLFTSDEMQVVRYYRMLNQEKKNIVTNLLIVLNN